MRDKSYEIHLLTVAFSVLFNTFLNIGPVGPVNGDKFIRVLNKGWYIANLKLTYEIQRGLVKESVTQTGSINLNQDYGFRVPFGVNYDSPAGCILEINAVAGAQVMKQRIVANPRNFFLNSNILQKLSF